MCVSHTVSLVRVLTLFSVNAHGCIACAYLLILLDYYELLCKATFAWDDFFLTN